MKRMSADEAAEIIQHDQMVAFSGFTPAGSPKALPAAIARRADELHRAQKPFQIPAAAQQHRHLSCDGSRGQPVRANRSKKDCRCGGDRAARRRKRSG